MNVKEKNTICATLILVSCDVSAARKICGYILVLVSCHQCEKKANYENQQHNFARIDDLEKWFYTWSLIEHYQHALNWHHCKSDASRKYMVKQTEVR